MLIKMRECDKDEIFYIKKTVWHKLDHTSNIKYHKGDRQSSQRVWLHFQGPARQQKFWELTIWGFIYRVIVNHPIFTLIAY